MSKVWTWLHVRRLRQYLAVALLTGVGGAWVGSEVSPVPGQLFADVAGIPLVYLSPVLVAVALAQWVPVGAYWFETTARPLASAVVMVVGIVLGFGPPLITSDATEVCWISARNGVLLVAAVLCARRFTSAAAASAIGLVPCFVVWTFGWSESGNPKPWAFLLLGPTTGWVLGLTTVLLVVGVAGTASLVRPAIPVD